MTTPTPPLPPPASPARSHSLSRVLVFFRALFGKDSVAGARSRRKTRTFSVAMCVGAGVVATLQSGCATYPGRDADVALCARDDDSEPITPMPEILSTAIWSFAGSKGEVIRTTHYRIYTTERNLILKRRLASFLEYALTHYRTTLTRLPAPPTRLDTYLMDNRPQWKKVTQRLMGEQSKQLTAIRRGGYASRGIGVFYDLGLFDTLAIASHEGWHQYTQRTFRDPLPIWLEEGVAAYMEGHRWSQNVPLFKPWANTERFDRLRFASLHGDLMSLEALLDAKPQDFLDRVDSSLLTYYAQAWALVHFLNEGSDGRHAEALRRLLREAASGELRQTLLQKVGRRGTTRALGLRVGPEVFRVYFGEDLKEAAREYDEFLSRLVRTGSRDAIVAGRSPVSANTQPATSSGSTHTSGR